MLQKKKKTSDPGTEAAAVFRTKMIRQAYNYIFEFYSTALWHYNCIGLLKKTEIPSQSIGIKICPINFLLQWNITAVLHRQLHNSRDKSTIPKQITESKSIMYKYKILSHSTMSHKSPVWVKNISWTNCFGVCDNMLPRSPTNN